MEEVARKRPIISAKERGQLKNSVWCVCASTWIVLKLRALPWNLSEHHKVVAPHSFEISTLFRIHSQTTEEELKMRNRRKYVKEVHVEMIRESKRAEPRICCIILVPVRSWSWALRSAPYSRVHQPWLHQTQQSCVHLPQPHEQRQ